MYSLLSRLKHPNMDRFYGFRGPWGLNFLRQGDKGRVLWVSRHPRWSITWLWFIETGPGVIGRRFGFHGARLGQMRCALNLGWFHIGLWRQEAMAQRPGRYGHDRKRWRQYCDKIARQHAQWAYEAEYRRKLAHMLEGNNDA